MSEQPCDERPRSAKKKWFVALFLLIILPAGGYYGFTIWKHAATHVSTDNAYVQADMAQITPRVHGTVIDALVHENWWVKSGQVLVRLDPRDYEGRLAEAKAALTRARESVDQLFAAVAVADERRRATLAQIQAAQAEVAVAQAEFRQAELDFHRAQQLADEQIIKETQLTQVRVGQPVEIRADVYPGYVYRGIVESLSGGTGAAFSLLPPENATGNWVKVVQRLPVKITLTEPPPPDLPLRVGLSVEASIDSRNRDGSRLNSLLQERGQKEAASGEVPAQKSNDLTTAPTQVALNRTT